MKSAMRQHRLRIGRFGDDRFREAVVALEERGDTARVVGFLVAGEQHGDRPGARLRCGEQASRRALDIAGAKTGGAVVGHPQSKWVGGPCRRLGTVSSCTLNTAWSRRARPAASGAGAMVGQLDPESG
jgi:hypothetical protein